MGSIAFDSYQHRFGRLGEAELDEISGIGLFRRALDGEVVAAGHLS